CRIGCSFSSLYGAHRVLHSFPTRRSSDLGEAKARLFQREELHFSVINFDDPFGRQLHRQLEGLCDRVRYSLHEAQTELWLREFTPTTSGFRALVDGQWGEFELQVPLLGSFKASNVLA